MPGNIIFKPLEANLTHSTSWLTKMDPYCTFIVGDQKIKTQVSRRGGKHPHWSDTITVPVSNESQIKVELMDKDLLSEGDRIGDFTVNLNEIQSQGQLKRWYPIFYKGKSAGEIYMESVFQGSESNLGANPALENQNVLVEPPIQASKNPLQTPIVESVYIKQENLESHQPLPIVEEAHSRLSGSHQESIGSHPLGVHQEGRLNTSRSSELGRSFVEQRQKIEPHVFVKELDIVETRPVSKQVEMLETQKVLKDVQVTEILPVKKQIETIQPKVVMKEVEVMEPRLVTKEIQVIENVPVVKRVEVIESRPIIKEIETYEPRVFTKQVEILEQVPVVKQVTVMEPVTFKKPVEFIEPIIKTQIITKEIRPPVVIDEKVVTEVGPARILDIESETRKLSSSASNFNSYQSPQNDALRQRQVYRDPNLAQSAQQPLIQQMKLQQNFGNYPSEQQMFAQESLTRNMTGVPYEFGNRVTDSTQKKGGF